MLDRISPLLCVLAMLVPVSGSDTLAAGDTLPSDATPPLIEITPSLDVGGLTLVTATARVADDASSGTATLEIAAEAGAEYPGVTLMRDEAWDLSGRTGIEAVVSNTGQSKVAIVVRVDNAGDWRTKPWSSTTRRIEPGTKATIRVPFGEVDGKPGFALDASKVSRVLIFALSPAEGSVFRVHRVTPYGGDEKPSGEVDPAGRSLDLLHPGKDVEANHITANGEGVEITSGDPKHPGIYIRTSPGENAYPGIKMTAPDGKWDLSRFGHVTARITNTGEQPIRVVLRIDNAGRWQDEPWNGESVTIAPGKTSAVRVVFGFANGHKPGFKLKSDAVTSVLVFAMGRNVPQSFRIESLTAAGVAGEKP